MAWHGVHASKRDGTLPRTPPLLLSISCHTSGRRRLIIRADHQCSIADTDRPFRDGVFISFHTRLTPGLSMASTATQRMRLACQSSRRTRQRSCAPASMCCISPAETSRIILAQCIKRLGEWSRYPSYRSPDRSLLSIGPTLPFLYTMTYRGTPWGRERGNHTQSLCEGPGRKVNANLGSLRSERLYEQPHALNMIPFFLYRKFSRSHRIPRTQTNSTQLVLSVQVFL
jgi:hypothetical protein